MAGVGLISFGEHTRNNLEKQKEESDTASKLLEKTDLENTAVLNRNDRCGSEIEINVDLAKPASSSDDKLNFSPNSDLEPGTNAV